MQQAGAVEPVSRWAARKEQKRQMYAQSTEGSAPVLSRRAKKEAENAAKACQKCLGTGHWTYECKNQRVYIARTSKTEQVWILAAMLVWNHGFLGSVFTHMLCEGCLCS